MVLKRMHLSATLLAVTTLAVMLLLAACTPGQPTAPTDVVDEPAVPTTEPVEEPTDEPAEEPAVEPTEEAAPAQDAVETPAEAGEAAQTFTFEGLQRSEFDSFAADVTLDFEGTDEQGQPVNVSFVMQMTAQRDPAVLAFAYDTAQFEGVETGNLPIEPEQMGELRFYVTEEAASMQIGSMCLAFPVQADDVDVEDAFGDMLVDPEEFTQPGGEVPELTLVGTETINGQETEHYRGENVSLSDLEQATIDLWYVPTGDYVTRLEVSGTTTGQDFAYGQGMVHMLYDVTSVNEPVNITVPENCQQFTIPEIPTPES